MSEVLDSHVWVAFLWPDGDIERIRVPFYGTDNIMESYAAIAHAGEKNILEIPDEWRQHRECMVNWALMVGMGMTRSGMPRMDNHDFPRGTDGRRHARKWWHPAEARGSLFPQDPEHPSTAHMGWLLPPFGFARALREWGRTGSLMTLDSVFEQIEMPNVDIGAVIATTNWVSEEGGAGQAVRPHAQVNYACRALYPMRYHLRFGPVLLLRMRHRSCWDVILDDWCESDSQYARAIMDCGVPRAGVANYCDPTNDVGVTFDSSDDDDDDDDDDDE